jgi:hypothetical protein
MRISNILVLVGGIFLLGVGIWTFENKTFTDDLLRYSTYSRRRKERQFSTRNTVRRTVSPDIRFYSILPPLSGPG